MAVNSFINPRMIAHTQREIRKARQDSARKRQVVACEWIVVDADSGDIVSEGFVRGIDAQRFASDRSHGDRSLVAIRL